MIVAPVDPVFCSRRSKLDLAFDTIDASKYAWGVLTLRRQVAVHDRVPFGLVKASNGD